ncbi:MAG: biotin/lipoyl-binding protein [Desulfosarcina sp.]|nr:biotin/lipoyl-binding protein [Desulfosarcina sp.]
MISTKTMRLFILLLAATIALPVSGLSQDKSGAANRRPPSPVTVVPVVEQSIARQVTLVGSVEAVATSMVAAEVGGVVEAFPAKEGRRAKKGDLLVRLKKRVLELELKGRVAERERIKANLENAQKELERVGRLRENNSIPQRTYDDALYSHRALSQALLVAESQIETLTYRIWWTSPGSGWLWMFPNAMRCSCSPMRGCRWRSPAWPTICGKGRSMSSCLKGTPLPGPSRCGYSWTTPGSPSGPVWRRWPLSIFPSVLPPLWCPRMRW